MKRPSPLKGLPIIYGAMVSGMVLFAGIVIFLIGDEMTFGFSADKPLPLVAVVFTSTAIMTSALLYPRLAKRVREERGPVRRKAAYRVACLVRWALVEGAALACVVLLLVTKNAVFLLLFAICLLYFLAIYPSRVRFSVLTDETRYVLHI